MTKHVPHPDPLHAETQAISAAAHAAESHITQADAQLKRSRNEAANALAAHALKQLNTAFNRLSKQRPARTLAPVSSAFTNAVNRANQQATRKFEQSAAQASVSLFKALQNAQDDA